MNLIDNINKELEVIKLDNGITIALVLKPEFSKTIASVTTKFGSLNNCVVINDKIVDLSDGLAHFLEHKMFEKETGDTFVKYAKYGGNANAFTSFDQTSYYFSCTDNFVDNFNVLLEMMTTPYFTKETVDKEKGIIGEEIKMYDDDSSWRLYYEVLKNLYESHPIHIDIAGTIESINNITAEELHFCYNTFYHPNNIIITVVGNFNKDEVLKCINNYYGAINSQNEFINVATEDTDLYKSFSEINMDVNMTKCAIGFKQKGVLFYDYKRETAINMYLNLLFGKNSKNYEMLASKELYPVYSYNELDTIGYCMISCDVNSEVEFEKAVLEILNSKVSKEDFDIYKNKNIGSIIRAFNSLDNYIRIVNDCFINDYSIEEMINDITSLTYDEMCEYAKELFDKSMMTKVIIKGEVK